MDEVKDMQGKIHSGANNATRQGGEYQNKPPTDRKNHLHTKSMIVISEDGKHHIVQDYPAQSGQRHTSTSIDARHKMYMMDQGSKIGIGSKYASLQPLDDDHMDEQALEEQRRQMQKLVVSKVSEVSSKPIGP